MVIRFRVDIDDENWKTTDKDKDKDKDERVTWDTLILERFPCISPWFATNSYSPLVRVDWKSRAHCKMFSMMLATNCVSSERKHLQSIP